MFTYKSTTKLPSCNIAPVAQLVSAPYLQTVPSLCLAQYEECGGCEFDPHPEQLVFLQSFFVFPRNIEKTRPVRKQIHLIDSILIPDYRIRLGTDTQIRYRNDQSFELQICYLILYETESNVGCLIVCVHIENGASCQLNFRMNFCRNGTSFSTKRVCCISTRTATISGVYFSSPDQYHLNARFDVMSNDASRYMAFVHA